jgi:hypothetical protein
LIKAATQLLGRPSLQPLVEANKPGLIQRGLTPDAEGLATLFGNTKKQADDAEKLGELERALVVSQNESLDALDRAKRGVLEINEEERVRLFLLRQGVDITDEQAAGYITVAKNIDAANERARQMLEQQRAMLDLYRSIGDSIQAGIVDSISSAIDGTKSLNEVLADTLSQIGRLLVQFAVASAFTALGNGAPAGSFLRVAFGSRASGGPVYPGGVYAVGDNPDGSFNSTTELFVPRSAGTIIPADETAALMSGEDDAISAARVALSRQVAATQMVAEREEYDRRSAGDGGNMKVEVIRVGDLNVVTEEQFYEAMARAEKRAAKEGEARMLRRMKNSTSLPGLR